MLCFVSTGLICKALSLGIVQFLEKLCLFVSKNFNCGGSDPMGVRSVTLTQIIMVLEHEKLFGNHKKCTFFVNEVTFSGYITTENGIKMDGGKVKAI